MAADALGLSGNVILLRLAFLRFRVFTIGRLGRLKVVLAVVTLAWGLSLAGVLGVFWFVGHDVLLFNTLEMGIYFKIAMLNGDFWKI